MKKLSEQDKVIIAKAREKFPQIHHIYWSVDDNKLGTMATVTNNYGITCNDFVALDKLGAVKIEYWEIGTYDEAYGGEYLGTEDEVPEILETDIANVEYDQSLVCQWVQKEYAQVDEFNREILTETTPYHVWTSERTRMIEEIQKQSELNEYDHFEIEQAAYNDLKEEWESIVKRYPVPSWCDIFEDEISFDALMKAADCTVKQG